MSLFKTFDSTKKNTESTERRKTSFLTEIVENADLYQTRIKQNNDNTRTMCKIRFCSSFKLVAEGGEFSRNIKKGRSQTFYKSIVVHSVTHAIDECFFNKHVLMWSGK